MNHSLIALRSKLNWQEHELNDYLQAAEKESQQLIQQINALDQCINQAGTHSLVIQPELEINKLTYITQQHGRKDELLTLLKNQQHSEMKLRDKLKRVKIELKMLEKYMEKEQLAIKEQEKKQQQLTIDEWALQQAKANSL